MQWFDVDGARDYLGQRGRKPSRKVIYLMVRDGMKVARIGAECRYLRFCAEWIDAFLIAAAQPQAAEKKPARVEAAPTDAGVALSEND